MNHRFKASVEDWKCGSGIHFLNCIADNAFLNTEQDLVLNEKEGHWQVSFSPWAFDFEL